VSLMARVHAHPRLIGPKMDSLSLRYFGLPPAQPLRLALVGSTDRYLRAWKPVPSCLQFGQQRVLSRFFSLLLPLPTAAFPTVMAKRKATTEEPGTRAESNGYNREAHREKDSTRGNGKHNKKTTGNQDLVLDRYMSSHRLALETSLRVKRK